MINTYLQIIQEGLNNNFRIGPSKIHGQGVIATKYIKPGEFINVALVPSKTNHKITVFGEYINHCDKPNAETRLKDDYYKTYCIEDIAPDDEITVDYRKNQSLEQPQGGWRK